MKIVSISVLFLVLSPISAQVSPGASKNLRRRTVSASQINGVYKYDRNDFRVLALGHNKLKAQFNGEWMTRGGYPNLGEAIGEATIEGNVATFIPGDTTKCKITMTFLRNKMIVEQEGLDADCGFGHNVVARGTYRRVK